jgi:hypothetical protein
MTSALAISGVVFAMLKVGSWIPWMLGWMRHPRAFRVLFGTSMVTSALVLLGSLIIASRTPTAILVAILAGTVAVIDRWFQPVLFNSGAFAIPARPQGALVDTLDAASNWVAFAVVLVAALHVLA